MKYEFPEVKNIWFKYIRESNPGFYPEADEWYRQDHTPVPGWCLIPFPHIIKDGDEFVLNKDCSIMFSGTVRNTGNEYKLYRYSVDKNSPVIITIIKV